MYYIYNLAKLGSLHYDLINAMPSIISVNNNYNVFILQLYLCISEDDYIGVDKIISMPYFQVLINTKTQ